MLLPRGCVQPSLAPEIDAATAHVLDALQIEAVTPKAACCGALRHHLGDDALDEIRHTIDAWWPHIESGVEAIVMNASGCAAMVKEYAYLLRHDTGYASKAARIAELTRDLAELLPEHVQTTCAASHGGTKNESCFIRPVRCSMHSRFAAQWRGFSNRLVRSCCRSPIAICVVDPRERTRSCSRRWPGSCAIESSKRCRCSDRM